MTKTKLLNAFLAFAIGSICNSYAQTIEIKSQEYVSTPQLPFEKPSPSSAHATTASQQSLQQQAGPVILGLDWRITPADSTISTALSRWGSQAGYQVVWQAEKDLPAFGAVYTGNFESVIESLMNDTVHSGYPLHACLYDNKVVRILHITQSCGK